ARSAAPYHTTRNPFAPPPRSLLRSPRTSMHVTPLPSTSAPVVLPPLAPGYAWTLTPHGWCPAPYDGPPLAPVPAPRPTTPPTPQAVLRAALFDLAARDPRLARSAV